MRNRVLMEFLALNAAFHWRKWVGIRPVRPRHKLTTMTMFFTKFLIYRKYMSDNKEETGAVWCWWGRRSKRGDSDTKNFSMHFLLWVHKGCFSMEYSTTILGGRAQPVEGSILTASFPNSFLSRLIRHAILKGLLNGRYHVWPRMMKLCSREDIWLRWTPLLAPFLSEWDTYIVVPTVPLYPVQHPRYPPVSR